MENGGNPDLPAIAPGNGQKLEKMQAADQGRQEKRDSANIFFKFKKQKKGRFLIK